MGKGLVLKTELSINLGPGDVGVRQNLRLFRQLNSFGGVAKGPFILTTSSVSLRPVTEGPSQIWVKL